MNARFILDWRFASKESLLIDRAYYGNEEGPGHTAIQIVASGPDSSREEVKHGYLKMISAAKNNIYIQTPYFVPDASIFESLKTAALSGVDVRVMIPCKPDHMFVYWATYSYAGALINAGARVYIYDNGFLHAKTMAVDGEVASIGSANFDNRSFRLNFESNAFIYDAAEAYKIEAIFETDVAQCHELTEELYRGRSIVIRFKEGVSRLLSGLL
jgi:cardiolipin synthase